MPIWKMFIYYLLLQKIYSYLQIKPVVDMRLDIRCLDHHPCPSRCSPYSLQLVNNWGSERHQHCHVLIKTEPLRSPRSN